VNAIDQPIRASRPASGGFRRGLPGARLLDEVD
jgi:hypothetical protein